MRNWIQIIILISLPYLLGAQSLSSKGRFSVDFNKGCDPLTVNITELDTFGSVTRQYYFFEGADITNSTSFTYEQPGIYEIVQVVGVDNIGDKSDTLRIEVVSSQKPQVTISQCSNFEISVSSQDTFYDAIRVYFGGADSTTLQINESTTFRFNTGGLKSIGLKGFFNNADEVCSTYFEEFVPIQALPAPTLLSASIKETCKDVYSLYLSIDQFDSLINYRINLSQGNDVQIFDGFLGSTHLIIPNIPFLVEDYCITIEAFDPCNGNASTSNEICTTLDALTLSPFESLYSSYEEGGIYINLDNVSTGSFEIYRRFEGSSFEFRTTTESSFTDKIGSQSRKYFYRIDYRDSCDQLLYSEETHPPFIDADLISENQYTVQVTPAKNSITGNLNSSYEVGTPNSKSVQEINTSPFELRLNANDGTPRQLLTTSIIYDSQETLSSNTLILKYELLVYVPSAFTPNGDGLNDRLEVFGLPASDATINIYSKWGQLIYTTVDPSNGWDGTVNGSLAPSGTYLYEITFETLEGKLLRQKGTFVLINK